MPVVTTKRKSCSKNDSSNWEKLARLSGSVGRTDPARGGACGGILEQVGLDFCLGGFRSLFLCRRVIWREMRRELGMRRKGGESSSLKPACGGEREKVKCYVEGKGV